MQLPVPSPTVVYQQLDEGAVLFAPESELYYGLNEVGAVIWQLLPAHRDLGELTRALNERYPAVAADTLRQDARELLESLAHEGLVRAADGDGASVVAPS